MAISSRLLFSTWLLASSTIGLVTAQEANVVNTPWADNDETNPSRPPPPTWAPFEQQQIWGPPPSPPPTGSPVVPATFPPGSPWDTQPDPPTWAPVVPATFPPGSPWDTQPDPPTWAPFEQQQIDSLQQPTWPLQQDQTDLPTAFPSTDASPSTSDTSAADTTGVCNDNIRYRYAWRDLTCEEQNTYLQAVNRLKASGLYDDFVRTHRWMNDDAHGVAEFLPWHRWFIYSFETALRQVADDPCITLPYWDWELDSDSEGGSIVFDQDTFGRFTGRSNGECLWRTIGGYCLVREMNDRVGFWSQTRVLAMITQYEQYTDDWNSNSNRNNGLRSALEGGPHPGPHQFIGGDMSDMSSPNDPLFFVHHSNVDRIWALWQDYRDHDQSDRFSYEVPVHYEGRNLDDPLPFPGLDRQAWDYRLSSTGEYPTAREMLSNNDIVQVRYMNDRLALALPYTPNQSWFQQAVSSDDQEVCVRVRNRRMNQRKVLERNRGDESGYVGKVHEMASTPSSPEQDKSPPAFAALRGRNPGKFGQQIQALQQVALQGPTNTTFTTSIDECMSMNLLSKRKERERWDRLCQELPLSTPYKDRLAALAQEECMEKGNPYGATEQWIDRMRMQNERASFECFHLPDRQ